MAIDQGKFKVFCRYLIQVAIDKRFAVYLELENLFGLSRSQVGEYLGALGDYCIEHSLPLLPALVINSGQGSLPSYGFPYYQEIYGKSWGDLVCDVLDYYHQPHVLRNQQKEYFAGMDAVVSEFLSDRQVEDTSEVVEPEPSDRPLV